MHKVEHKPLDWNMLESGVHLSQYISFGGFGCGLLLSVLAVLISEQYSTGRAET